MKRVLRIVVPLILAIAVIGCMFWYLFVYDRDFTKDLLLQQARNFESMGNLKVSAWLYDLAYYHSSQEPQVAIEHARQYKAAGNYTKAEYTLTKAIAQSSSVELYAELCAVYVEQDKLLDAVTMLDSIQDPAIKKDLDARRPKAPSLSPESGFYTQYISVSAEADSGTLYMSVGREYPSTAFPYTAPVALPAGETTVYALAVGADSLVSPLAVGGYTIGGVVELVTFSDRAIEAEIRDILNVGVSTALYTNDLWPITQFTVPEEATVYDDLGLLTYLRSLNILNGLDSDLSCLSKLTALEELTITNSRLDDAEISAIGALTSLQRLNLTGCNITSISPLATLKNLVSLDLSGNSVRNISALSDMEALRSLSLHGNAVTDLSSLSGLTSLEKLNVSNNSLTSLDPIGGISSLQELDASHNQITFFEDLDSLTNLTVLRLGGNSLIDVSAVAVCTKLTELDLSNNSLTSLEALSPLSSLTTLNFAHNQVAALPTFSKSCLLVTIDGSYNDLASLEPLSGLKHLNNVLVDYNARLSSLKPLDTCPLLVKVNAYGTRVREVSFLTEKSIIVNFDPTV